MAMNEIIIGGGCFWCIESIFQEINGVSSAISGYAGGFDEQPTYKTVCAGITGHTEVVKLQYDDEMITLAQILEMFFTLHNPTTLNRQGNDVGTQYRSSIYYTHERDLAIIDKAIIEAEELWGLPVVTEVKLRVKFYEAEAYHQNYYQLNPNQGYCQYVISPKLNKLRKSFTAYLKMLIVLIFTVNGVKSQPIILHDTIGPNPQMEGIPTLRVNFYLLDYGGMIDSIIDSQIVENIEFLNQEFEGSVRFALENTIRDNQEIFLPDIYSDFYDQSGDLIRSFTDRIEQEGSINIYISKTYLDDGASAELMGFTPVLKAKQYAYRLNSPRFDRIYISYSGLQQKTTLVHEMGHFLGLKHPWMMHPINLDLLGLTSDEIISDNHMSYTEQVHEFTLEQLENMQHFALEFRRYLADDIEITQP